MPRKLLIIEDDHNLNQMLALHFEDQGYFVEGVDNCAQGLQSARDDHFDFVLLDQQLPDGLGIETLPKLIAENPHTPIIMMTGAHDLELAIEAIKLGAADFVHKPVKADTLQAAVDKVLNNSQTVNQEIITNEQPVRDLIGRSSAMLEVSKQIALSASNQATVLLHGESGTGKEVVARLIHQHSDRDGEFVAINCAAIVDTLLESELFGHEKGAFTGADKNKIGKFEQAENGTLFLDEIAELALPLQAKLLRALQERSIERVGSNNSIPINTRIIAASHQDLFNLAEQDEFREDLAYRLSVVNIHIPALKNRPEDIPLLAQALLEKAAIANNKQAPVLSEKVVQHLMQHDWPGNVRELENTLIQALIQARDGVIGVEHVHFRQHPQKSDPCGQSLISDEAKILRSLDQVEAEHIQAVLTHTQGHKGKSCEILGISRPALDRKITKYSLKLA